MVKGVTQDRVVVRLMLNAKEGGVVPDFETCELA